MAFYRKWVFPLLSLGLWLTFLTLDLTGLGDSTWVKFTAICLCCLTALPGAKTTDGRLVAVALCFTVGADWFLLVRNDHYSLGLCLFIVVQFLYAYRLYLLCGQKLCKWSLFRLLGLLILLPGPALGYHGRLYALTAIYFFNLCLNTVEAFRLDKPRPPFAWGLLLFVCCDICVGFSNLNILTSVTWWLCWAFYLPSQVLIVLSQEQEKGELL